MPTLLTCGLLGPPGGLLTGGLGVFGAPTAVGSRDWDLADAIAEALEATHEFSEVVSGEDPGSTGSARGSDLSFVAAVDVGGFQEMDQFSDDAEAGQVRKVTGTVTLLGVGQYRREVKRELDRLGALVQNTIDGSDLGGPALPDLTKCRQGKYQDKPSGEVRLVLSWEATVLISGYAGHSTDEDDG